MKEPHLEVQPDTLDGPDQLGHQQAVAESEHCIDRIPWRSPDSRVESETAVRYNPRDCAKVDSGRVSLNPSHLVRGRCIDKAWDPAPNLLRARGKLARTLGVFSSRAQRSTTFLLFWSFAPTMAFDRASEWPSSTTVR